MCIYIYIYIYTHAYISYVYIYIYIWYTYAYMVRHYFVHSAEALSVYRHMTYPHNACVDMLVRLAVARTILASSVQPMLLYIGAIYYTQQSP